MMNEVQRQRIPVVRERWSWTVTLTAAMFLAGLLPSQSRAAATLVQHTSKDAGIVAASSSLAFPANNTAGNWIGVVIRAGHSGQVFTVTDTRGNTYKQAVQFNQTLDGPNGETLAIYYAESVGAGANTVTVSQSLANNTLRFAILEYSGISTSNSIDVTSAAQGSGTTLNSGTITTSVGGDLILGEVTSADGRTFTAGSGYVIEENVPAAPNTKLIAEDAVQAVAGAVSVGATLSSSDNGGALLAAFKAAGGTLPPSVSTLTPNSGPVGTSVTIAGANFGASQGTSTVTFNGVSAGTTSGWSASSISISVPPGATSGGLVVTVGGVQSNSVNFTVSSTGPSITMLTPNNGPAGTSITIAGSNFGASQGTSAVAFNGTSAGAATSWSASSITVSVPSGATTGSVVVTVGGQASNGLSFTVTPTISSVLNNGANSGPVGTPVTITGANFGASQGPSTVTFNGVAATPTSWSNTSIVAPVPSGAATGPVVVTVGGFASNGVNFTVTAKITGLSPSSGPRGTSVTVSGSNFGATQGSSTLTFGGVLDAPSSWSDTSLGGVIVPNLGAGTWGVQVFTVGGLGSNSLGFLLTPAITNLSPTSGPVGTLVTITGSSFGAAQGSNTVTFNGTVATPTSWSDSSIVVAVPSGATTGNVVVTANGVASNGVDFTDTSTPAPIKLVQQASKDAGTTSPTSLAFPSANTAGNWIAVVVRGGKSGQVFTVSDSLHNTYKTASQFNVTVDTPNGDTLAIFYAENIAGGANTVAVANSISGNTLRFAILEYTGVALANSIDIVATAQGTSAAPNSGSATTTANGDVLLGAAMTGGSETFTAGSGYNTEALVPAEPNSKLIVEDQIQAAAGSASAGATIGASDHWGAILAAFKAAAGGGTAAPTISSLTPNSGPIGTPVTIAGANFGASQGNSTVTFNGVPAGAATSWSASSITVNVPSGATSGGVIVTAGGVASNALTFTVASTAPNISGLTPNNGSVGTLVTIAGSNFGGSQGSSTVTFNGTPAGTAITWGPTSITVQVPANATSGSVIVTVGGQASNAANFTVTVPSTSGIRLVQHASIDGGITPSASLAFPSSNTAGNFIAVVIRGGKTPQVFTVSDSLGNTYQQAIQVNLSVDPETVAVYYAESIAGGSNTVTVSESIPNNTLRFALLEYSGVAPSGSLDVTTYAQGSDTAPSSGNTATTAVAELLIAEMTNGDGTAYAAGGGFTSEEVVPAAPGSKLLVEDTIQPLPGVVSATAFMSSLHNWGALLAAFRPSTGSASPHIVNLSPSTAPVGALVTIAGTNFGASQGTSTVTMNGTLATPRSWNSDSIVVPVPAGASSGNVVVTVGGTASNGVNFTVGFGPPIAFVQVNASLSIDQPLPETLSFVTVPFKGAQTTGNLNVVVVGWHDSVATINSVTDSAGNVYRLAAGPTVSSGAATQAVYYANDILPSPPNGNVVGVSFNGLATNPDVRIAEYAGLDPANPVDVNVAGQGSSATSGSGAISTTNANDLLVGVNVVSAPSSAAGAGYTSRVISQNGGILEDQIVTAAASYGATASLTASGNWIMQMVAFKAPTAATSAISVAVSPGNANAATGYGSQTFSATLQNDVQRLGVTWALSGSGCTGSSCGTLSNISATTATYTGPANLPSPALVTLTATSVADPSKSGSAAITVTPGTLNVAVFPKRAAVTMSQVQQFTATVTNDPANAGVVWSVDGNNGGTSTSGMISSTGLFTPGTQAGLHTVTATSVSDSSVNLSATIAVTDFAGSFSFHYNPQSTGENTQEYALTTTTVNSSTFGLLFSCPVDGFLFATPLYAANMTFGAQERNVVYIATEHNSVYAFDADSPSCTPLWKTSFLSSGVLTVPPSDTGDTVSLVTEFGITSTPVIDPASNTIYVVANTKEVVGSGCSTATPCYFYRLHALDLTTGAEKFGGPVIISAPNFNPLFELQRPALQLSNGTVYVGFGSHADLNTWQGWLMAYNASTLTQTYAWSSTLPTGGNNEGALWGAGNPPVVDASGDVYVITGNGTWDGTQNFADSVVKLSSTGSVLDYFTPFDQMTFAANDIDLGSSGAIILPNAVGSTSHPQLVLASGKVGVLYLLDQSNLGKFNFGANADLQEVDLAFNTTSSDSGFFGQPAYWNGNIYTVMTGDSLRQFPISNAVITNPASSVAGKIYTYRGATPSVSSSGTTNGIVWVNDITDYQSNGPTLLDAYDATRVASMIYSSPVNGPGAACSASKFTTPVVANGKVYISGSNCFSVFGLLPN